MPRLCVAVLCLLGLSACADPGPRDRSALLPSRRTVVVPLNDPSESPGTVIGLEPDPLGALYPEGPDVVLHFSELSTLERVAVSHFTEVRRLLPVLKLPDRAAAEVLRSAFQLSPDAQIQPGRPFSVVRWRGGWLAVLPLTGSFVPHEGLRPLDDRYSVVGPAPLVRSYVPAGRAAFRLHGHVSAHIAPKGLAELRGAIAEALTLARLAMPDLPASPLGDPRGLARIDFAAQFDAREVRVDVRLTPRPDAPLATALAGVQPSAGRASPVLPIGGTLYGELLVPAGVLVAAHGALGGRQSGEPSPVIAQALQVVGDDVAWSFHLDADNPGVAYVVAAVHDPTAAQAFLRSAGMEKLLAILAGPDGRLEWTPNAFRRGTVDIGEVRGSLSRSMLTRWRESGTFAAVPGAVLRGPVEAYVAVAGDKLVAVIGQRSKSAAERFVDALASGAPPTGTHAPELAALELKHAAAVTADLAALLDGVRDSAPFWTETSRPLLALRLRARVPLTAALSVEHGALRISTALNPRLTAALAAKAMQLLGIEQSR